MRNLFDRLARVLFRDDTTQPKVPVFACPVVIESFRLGTTRWTYRAARQRADGSLEGAGPWRACPLEANADVDALLEGE